MSVSNLLMTLLIGQLKNEKLNSKVISNISQDDIKVLYRLSCMHSVTNITYQALIDNGVSLDQDVKGLFKREVFKLNTKSQRLSYDAEKIFSLLNKEKIYFIPLKGIVTKNYYNSPELRYSADVDILIKPEDEERVYNLLTQNLNYTFIKSYKDEKTFQTESGEYIETHLDITDGEKEYAEIYKDVFEMCTSNEENKYELSLSSEYLAVYNVTHQAKHFRKGGSGLRPLLDAYIIKERIGYDEETVLSLLEKIGLKKFYLGIMEYIYCIAENRQLSNDLKVLQSYIMLGGNYGSVTNKALLESVKQESKFKSFFKNAFPSFSQLKGSYKCLEKCTILYPFCIVARWFSAIFGKRKDKLKDKKDKKSQITAKEKEKVSNMLNMLGL